MDIDYAMLVKQYGTDNPDVGSEVRYSPALCTGAKKQIIIGHPDKAHVSTSMRRFTRLTKAFSKKLENHCATIALHFMHYNFCRIHQTLRITPAMAAGVSDHVWEVSEIVDLLSA